MAPALGLGGNRMRSLSHWPRIPRHGCEAADREEPEIAGRPDSNCCMMCIARVQKKFAAQAVLRKVGELRISDVVPAT